jgi:formate hydrogenlyase subunit 6/NADH:ubiquinone oxidoreductase subunit I
MKVGTMITDLLRSLFKKPATERYPFVKREAPPRFRGKLYWVPEKCTGCQLCIKDCPANAIELIVIDKAAKRFVMRYHADHCTYCAQCVESCRFKCLNLSNKDWEMAAMNKQPLEIYYGRDEDLAFLLEHAAKAGTEQPCGPA